MKVDVRVNRIETEKYSDFMSMSQPILVILIFKKKKKPFYQMLA